MKQHQTAKLSPKLSKIPQTSGAALGHLGPPWATATPWVSPSRAVEQHAARRRAAAARCPQGPGGRTWRRSFFWHVLLVDDFYHTKNETEIWTQVIYIYNIYIYIILSDLSLLPIVGGICCAIFVGINAKMNVYCYHRRLTIDDHGSYPMDDVV